MSKIAGSYNNGKVQVAVFKGSWEGKETTSFTVSKQIYKKETSTWEKSDFFTLPDLRDLVFILNKICEGGVKMRAITPKPVAPVAPTSTAPEFTGELEGEEPIPF